MDKVAEVALVVMAAANILWGIVALGVLFGMVRMFGKLWPALDRLEANLRPGMRKGHEMLMKASRVADTVNEKADRVEEKLIRVDETTERVWDSADRARIAMNERLIPVKSFIVGVRTGARVFSREWRKPKAVPRPASAHPQAIPSESWRAA